MIAADTNTWIAYLEGQSSEDTVLLDQALIQSQLLMPPVVLSELLSDPSLRREMGAAGYERAVYQFDLRKHVTEIENFYDELPKGNSSPWSSRGTK